MLRLAQSQGSVILQTPRAFDGSALQTPQMQGGIGVLTPPGQGGAALPGQQNQSGPAALKPQQGQAMPQGQQTGGNAGGNGGTSTQANLEYLDWKKTFTESESRGKLTSAAADDIIQLSENEQWALNEYISSGGYKIHASLRDGSVLTDEQRRFVEYFDSTLKKCPFIMARWFVLSTFKGMN